MIPNFRIETNGKDLTDAIRSRLIRLSIKDEASLRSDCMSLDLADDPPIEWPADGQVFNVAIGYDAVLTSIGRFATKHIDWGGPPAVLKIQASSLDQNSSLKSQREESWDSTTLGAIGAEIARRNGLKPAVFDELDGIIIEHEDQTESDMAFLCRLGRRYDLTVKVSGRFLMISPADKSDTANGGSPEPIRVSNPTRVSFSGDQTKRYTGVRAFWYDNDAAAKRQVLYGKEGVVLELEFNKISEAGARKAAEAKFREVVRKGKTLTFSVPGNTELSAERKLLLSGVRAELGGEWIIKSVEHVIDSAGFMSNVECSVDGYRESAVAGGLENGGGGT